MDNYDKIINGELSIGDAANLVGLLEERLEEANKRMAELEALVVVQELNAESDDERVERTIERDEARAVARRLRNILLELDHGYRGDPRFFLPWLTDSEEKKS